ncbi:MAG: hypothetical protein JXA97_01965 [Anaerolineales bacterium]|nr:hypothetical protein [Anaerolineales bacterium]
MTNEPGKGLSLERILLILVSVLLIVAIVVIVIFMLSGRQASAPAAEEPAPASAVEEDQPAPQQPAPAMEDETSTAGAEPTSGPRRLEVQPTATPFSVLSEDDVRSILDLANPDHLDYFTNEDAWLDYDTEVATYRIEDGHLLGIDHEPEESYAYWSHNSMQSGNVYAEISATNGDCLGRDSVGLNVRIDPEISSSGYALEVSCDGAWRFRRHRPNKSPEELASWTPSDAIQTGAFSTNRLGIWAYQGRFVLFINGMQVADIFDADYPYTYGYFSAYVRSSMTYDLTATFDDFAFWHIPFIP